MIIERELEQNFKTEFQKLDALSCYQISTARELATENDTKVEDEDKTGIVTIACGYRSHDAFSCSPISIPVTIALVTRIENDTSGEQHEKVIEEITNILSYWHRYQNTISCLDCTKFRAGELRCDGGSGRTYDTTNRIWSDSINLAIRGAEIFS